MKKYTREEVKVKALEWFKGDTLATDVWINKYALKDSEDNIYELTPDDMHWRLSRELGRIEAKYVNPLSEDKIFELIKDFKYIVPQGGSMSGIGNNLQIVSLSNCFVVGNDSDSYGGICQTDQEQVQLMKRRGGVGHDLSHLRPKGVAVKNSALTSTGVVPFMERYSNSTREVAQDGRRGALMLSISTKHPDIEDFIDAKMTAGKVTGANVSVKISDDFMESIVSGEKFVTKFPIGSLNPILTKEVSANDIWKKIVHNAWKSAEPGILFWDNIIKESIPDCYGEEWKTTSTNPCLTADSLIMTNNGEITIKEIFENFNNQNYEVLTFNEKTKELEYNKVGDALLTKRNANIIELEFEDGVKLKLTPDHKVYTENRGWVEASKLTENDILLEIELKRTKLKSINIIQNEDVYDLKVYNNHNFFANKLLVHNCGEIPLCPYDSCRLLALNLYSYVVNPFTKEAYFDFELFKEHSIYAQRLMDDIVDLEIEKIDIILEKVQNDNEPDDIKRVEFELWTKIKEKAEFGRRTGLGITAEGDMLAALGLKYGTTEATKFAVEVHKVLAVASYTSSIIMSKERGSFKVWDYETEINNPFIQRIYKELDEQTKADYKQYGRRNIASLTIAPTGCLVEDSIIKTENGDIKLSELFLLNGINLNDLKGLKDIWIDVNHETNVYDVNGGTNKITKLYWNGESETKKMTLSDGSIIESTLEHKFLVKLNEDEAIWKSSVELVKGDRIIKML